MLTAYEWRCAVCGLDVRLGSVSVALDAAHIRWHQAGGPDREGNGLALCMKIASNLSLAVQMMAFSEGVLIAEKSGIAREVAVDVLTHSAIASPMIQYRGPFVLQQPEQAWFDVNMMQKDMLLAMELGRKLNIPLPTTAASNEFLTAARGMGWAKLDFAVMFDVLAAMSGVSTPVTEGVAK